MTYTLRKLITEHPEWLDYPIALINREGTLLMVGDEHEEAGVRLTEDDNEDTLVLFWS